MEWLFIPGMNKEAIKEDVEMWYFELEDGRILKDRD